MFLGKRKRIPNKDKSNRRGRIVIRNLSFKTTEDKYLLNLRKHFEEFGKITDLKLLKRPDGKLVGCAFIQYDVVQNAAKAIHHRSGKEFLGRPIICDWAIPKDTYVKNVTKENVKDETIEIKDEPVEVKEEPLDDICEIKEESNSEKSESDHEESDEESSDENDSESEESVKEEPEEKRPRIISNDVNEGKTVFIKNVPFAATNEDLKECMSQFGSIYYALICVDPVTEHSKGTAFVKFRVSYCYINNLQYKIYIRFLKFL